MGRGVQGRADEHPQGEVAHDSLYHLLQGPPCRHSHRERVRVRLLQPLCFRWKSARSWTGKGAAVTRAFDLSRNETWYSSDPESPLGGSTKTPRYIYGIKNLFRELRNARKNAKFLSKKSGKKIGVTFVRAGKTGKKNNIFAIKFKGTR